MSIAKNNEITKNITKTLTDSYSIIKLYTCNPGHGVTFGADTSGSSSAASLLSRDLFTKTVHLNNDIIKTNMHVYIILLYKKRERETKK